MTEGRDLAAARCTGECCRIFSISREVAGEVVFYTSPDELSEELRPLLVRTDKIPPGRNPDVAWFVCRQWDAQTGRCLAYADRPPTCSLYPYDYCRHCGAGSAAEASGVALMTIEAR